MPVQNELQSSPKKKDFPAIEADVYQVQIMDITDRMKVPWGAPKDSPATEPFLGFQFAIMTGEHKGRYLFHDVKPVTPVPSAPGRKPSWLWKIVSAVKGHPLTHAEGEAFNKDALNGLIGQQLRVVVNRIEKGDKVYNNVTDFMEAKTLLEPLVSTKPDDITIDNSDIPF